MTCCYSKATAEAQTKAEQEKEKEQGMKRSNPFEKWRTRAKKPKVELDREPYPTPDVPQPAELKDDLGQEPSLDLGAIDDIIEEELAMPLQSEKVSEETFDAEDDDAKLEIHLQKFAEEKIYPTLAQVQEEKHIAMLNIQKVQEYFQKVSQNDN